MQMMGGYIDRQTDRQTDGRITRDRMLGSRQDGEPETWLNPILSHQIHESKYCNS